MNKEQLIESLSSFIKNGLNMDKYSAFECNLFMKDLNSFINSSTPFNAHYSGDKVLIESIFFDPMLSVELDKTTIQCIPVNDEGWIDAVFEVVKFVHLRETKKREDEKEKKKKEEQANKEFDWI